MKHKKQPFEFRCEKCGKEQPRDESMSTEEWAVYPCNQKCGCGGEFVMWMDGEPM